MKKTIIEGKIKKEIEILMESVSASKTGINHLTNELHIKEKRMWDLILNEFPDISRDVNLSNEDGILMIKDYNPKKPND